MANTGTNDQRTRTGEIGEAAARELIARRGWQIVDHNVRWREGELDLIAVDGRTLVFGEVKTLIARDGTAAFSPLESIGARKQAQIRSLARRWLSDELRRCNRADVRFNQIRFDAFAVTIDRRQNVLEIEHLEDAF